LDSEIKDVILKLTQIRKNIKEFTFSLLSFAETMDKIIDIETVLNYFEKKDYRSIKDLLEQYKRVCQNIDGKRDDLVKEEKFILREIIEDIEHIFSYIDKEWIIEK